MYEQSRQLAQASMQHWLSNEVFSLGWFVLLGILIIAYIIWFKLLDKSKTSQLLLIGSLAAVAYIMNNSLLGDLLGVTNYAIRLFPLFEPIFVFSVTLSPIVIMLAQQYTSSWKGYALWNAVGFAVLNFVIGLPLILVGVIEFKQNWNIFYTFLDTYAISFGVRLIFLWITGTQKRYIQNINNERIL